MLRKNKYISGNIDTFIEDVSSLEKIPKRSLIIAQLNENFLNFRVLELQNKDNFPFWTDDYLKLKPCPAFDIALLELNEAIFEKNKDFLHNSFAFSVSYNESFLKKPTTKKNLLRMKELLEVLMMSLVQ